MELFNGTSKKGLFSRRPLLASFLYYLFYCLLLVVINTAFVSIISFFHFLLGHRFSLIEDWIFTNIWLILCLVKLCAFIILLKFLALYTRHTGPLTYFLRADWLFPTKHIFVIIIFLYALMIPFGESLLSGDFVESPFKIVLAFLGIVSFYFVDYVLLSYLRFLFPLQKKEGQKTRKIAIVFFDIFFPLMFWFTGSLIVMKNQHYSWSIYTHMVTALLFLELRGGGQVMSMIYFALFAAPMGVIMGIGLRLDNVFTTIKINNNLNSLYYFGLWVTILLYLWWVRRGRYIKEISYE